MNGPAAFGAFLSSGSSQRQLDGIIRGSSGSSSMAWTAAFGAISSAATAAAAAAASAISNINLNIAASHSTRQASSTLVAGFIELHMLPTSWWHLLGLAHPQPYSARD
jgi:hypothetical protein